MRVLFFTTSGSYHGGGVMCLMEMLQYAKEFGIEPYVVIPTHGSVEQILDKMSIPYKIIRTYDWLTNREIKATASYKLKKPMRIIINAFAEMQFKLYMKQNSIQAFHLNSVFNKAGVTGARTMGIPVIWHIREFAENGDPTPVFHKSTKAFQFMEKADCMVAVSDCIKEFYSRKMPSAKILRVYDGIQVPKVLPVRELLSTPEVRLAVIGGVAPIKGFEDAIEAVSYCNKHFQFKCKLTIVGRKRNGSYENKIDEMIKTHHLKDMVHFYGVCEDMENIWKSTDIVLVCSRSESFGRVAVEAMVNGIPVIGADNSGTKELLPPSNLYKTGDYADLARKIAWIVDQNGNEGFQKNIKQLQIESMSNYDIKRSAFELFEIIETAIREG